MSNNITNEDLRSVKTERALHLAMYSLLKNVSFKKITVKGICEEALISRAAFYAHFVDKYDLLKHWITNLWASNISDGKTYRQMQDELNFYIRENAKILKNLLYEADNETYIIIFDFVLSTQNLALKKYADIEKHQKNVVLSTFYAGGIISYLLWQIKNGFPSDIPPINDHVFDMISSFRDLQNK